MSELITQFDGEATSGATPIAVTSTEVTVLGPLDLQGYDRFTLYAQNVGGGLGASLSLINVEAAPVDDAASWFLLESVIAADLISGAQTYISFSDLSHKYIRVRAACTANNTTAKFWLSAGGKE